VLLTIIVISTVATLTAILVAALEARLRDFVGQLFLALLTLLREMEQPLEQGITWLRNQIGRVFGAMSDQDVWPGWRVLGSLLYLGVLLVSIIGDAGLVLLTFDAMKLGSSGGFSLLGMSADVYSVLALLGAGTVFGLVLMDLLRLTHFGPWPDRDAGIMHKLLLVTAVVGLAGAIATSAVLGLWRGMQIAPGLEEAPPGGIDTVAPVVASTLITIPLMMATALSGWALVWVAATVYAVFLALLMAALWVSRTPLRLGAAFCDRGYALAAAGISMIATPGRTSWNWVCSFEPVRTFFHIGPIEPPSESKPPPGTELPPQDAAVGPAQPQTFPSSDSARTEATDLDEPAEELGLPGSGEVDDDPHHYLPFGS
jgi:hypothetical protein